MLRNEINILKRLLYIQIIAYFYKIIQFILCKMKKSTLVLSSIAAISLGIIYSVESGNLKVHDDNGRYGKTGSPGETTCSDAGCHGAGNGGIADNAGTGSVVITTSPVMTNNTYVPGQSYTVTVTVSEQGKSSFGFNFEALDNSGSSAVGTNNAVGTLTITDATFTKTGTALGAKRVGVTHKTVKINSNSASFSFTWKAPTTGIVNMYASGNAANNNGQKDGGDNIYTTRLQLSPVVAGINDELISKYDLSIYPNPIVDNAALKAYLKENSAIEVSIADVNGNEVQKQNFAGKSGNNTFDLNTHNLSKGSYFARIFVGDDYMTYKVVKK